MAKGDKRGQGSKAEDLWAARLEARGWMVHVAKPYRVRFGNIVRTMSNDIWGTIDLLCVHPKLGFWFIQATTKAGVSARKRKMEGVPWPSEMVGLRLSIFEAAKRREGRRVHHYAIIHDLDDFMWTKSEEEV